MTVTRIDIPSADESTQDYWDAARRGVLLIQRCAACTRPHFYPRPFCPFCWSSDVQWEVASGRAELYTFSIVRRNDLAPFTDRVPYVAGIVELAEGPRAMTNIVHVELDDVHIGMALQATFVEIAPDVTVPMFEPVSPGSE
jgi:uncharacterized OB-fold protein